MKPKNIVLSSIVVVLWASTSVIGRFIVGINSDVTPLQLAFLRYGFGAIGLIGITLLTGNIKFEEIRGYDKKHRIIFAILTTTVFPLFMFYGVERTTAIANGVLLNLNTIFIVFMSVVFLNEKVRMENVIGIILGIVGAIIIVLSRKGAISLATLGEGTGVGNVLSLLAGITWAIFTIMLKAWFETTNPLETMTVAITGASIILLFVMLFIDGFPLLTLQLLLLVFILGVGATSIAFFLYIVILQEETAIATGAIQLAVPVVGIVMSIVFLGEVFYPVIFAGTVLVLVGLYLVNKLPQQEQEITTL